MEQCHAILKPGGIAVWVVKAFVRDKAIVDFPDQWRQLGEACGFTTLEWIRAWLIEDRANATALFDFEVEVRDDSGLLKETRLIKAGDEMHDAGKELKDPTLKRSSFFRNLYERKYPGNSIDYEVVLVQRKV